MTLFAQTLVDKLQFFRSAKRPVLHCIRLESSLASLRKKTGYALNLCKQALEKHNNDSTAAERWLKEQAAIHGWAKASKLQGRQTAEGLIGVYINKQSNMGLALELNCETDFVARNGLFRALTASLTSEIASSPLVASLIADAKGANDQLVCRAHLNQEKLEPFREKLVSSVSKLGENLVLKRAIAIASRSPIHLIGYAHAVGGVQNALDNVFIGKYGTILAYSDAAHEDLDYEKQWLAEREEASEKSSRDKRARQIEAAEREIAAAKDLGQDIDEDAVKDSICGEEDDSESSPIPKHQLPRLLCQHIIGMKPSKVRYSHNELLDLLKLSHIRKQSGNAGEEDEESEALLDQKFIINNVEIRKVLKQTGLSVIDFERIQCGQSE